MSALVTLWTAVGLTAGAVHAAALWRSTHSGTSVVWSAALRMPLVGAALVAAAYSRALLPAAGGWIVGLIVTAALLVLRHQP